MDDKKRKQETGREPQTVEAKLRAAELMTTRNGWVILQPSRHGKDGLTWVAWDANHNEGKRMSGVEYATHFNTMGEALEACDFIDGDCVLVEVQRLYVELRRVAERKLRDEQTLAEIEKAEKELAARKKAILDKRDNNE